MKSSLDESCRRSMIARDIMKGYPEVELLLCQVGRPDDGTDPSNFFNAEFYLPLKPIGQWPILPGHTPPPHARQEIIDDFGPRVVAHHAGRRLEHFAEHPQHGDGIALWGPRRELREDHRPGPRRPGSARRQGGEGPRRRPRRLRHRRVPHHGPVQPDLSRRPREVRPLGRQRRRRAGRDRHGGGRQGPEPDDRRRAELRHHAALARRPARRRAGDPQHSLGGAQQQRDLLADADAGEHAPQRRRQRTGGDRLQREHALADGQRVGRGGERPDADSPPPPRRRDHAPGFRRPLRRRGLLGAAGRLGHLPRPRAAAHRRQVRRPRPRPGRRRGRGAEKSRPADRAPLSRRNGPANSTKCKRPKTA